MTQELEVGGHETPISVSTTERSLDLDALTKEGLGIIQSFGGQLKPELKSAMQSGGTAQAISLCAEKAPAIATSLSQQTGWNVQRVSLKARNASSAQPDAWERATLEWFDAQVAEGVDASTLMKAEVVDGYYRLMKAQPVEGLCLSCHGTALSPETEVALQQYYPNDLARGYTLGQIRGAFSIEKVLD